MITNSSDPFAQLASGDMHQSQGKLDAAVVCYRAALALKPDFSEACNSLGAALQAQGHLDDAVDSYHKAIQLRPDNAEAYNNLGAALQASGQLDKAADAYRAAISRKPGFVVAHYNLAILLQQRNKLDEAIDLYRSTILLDPTYAEAYYNLGTALLGTGQLDEAVTTLREAVSLKPDFAAAHNNLGNTLYQLGQIDAALSCCQRALALEEAIEFKATFVQCLKNRAFTEFDADFRRLVIRAISEAWAWQSELTPACCSLIKLDRESGEYIERVSRVWPTRLTSEELYGPAGLSALSNDLLLLALLENSPVCDVAIERFLTMMRHAMLDAASASESGAALAKETLTLFCALARQCFINEYVFSFTDGEISRATSLREKFVAALESGKQVPPLWIAAVASYWPLSTVPGVKALAHLPFPESIKELLAQQVLEPVEEQGMRDSMPRLTTIDAGVSSSVRQQYEENPYPRWMKVPPTARTFSVDGYIREHFSFARSRPMGKGSDIEILVAGCGTGLEAIANVRTFPGARVLAIDLSLSSLCYAKRKTGELGLQNIEYAQADIMKLGSIHRTFDVISSTGVLHHLADPRAGLRVLHSLLRPDGFMRLGLYSELAREIVVAARSYIQEQQYASSATEIRRCRQEMLDRPAQFGRLTSFRDFFVTSECRDMLFHVQEHRFTLPQIKEMIEELGLRFIGFTPDGNVIREFKERFAEDDAQANLDYWHYFETEFPDTFIGMYQFWVQKPAQH